MNLDNTLEGNVEEQLVVSTTLDPVLGRSIGLALVQSTWLGAIEEDLDGAKVLVSVQQLAVPNLNLIRDIAVASWDLGSLPLAVTATARTLPERLDLAEQLLDDSPQLMLVCALDFINHLSITEDEKRGERGDAIFFGDVLLVVAVDLDKGDGVGA